jgi:hypothetical protein
VPTAGLTLVGFMTDAQQAINHLRNACVFQPPNDTDAALTAEWQAAQAQLAAPIANAGNPTIQNIPVAHQPYLQQFSQNWGVQNFNAMWPGWDFKLVEIEPLLAYQFTVDLTRSAHHCGQLPNNPPVADLLPICLPQQQVPVSFQSWQQPNSVILRSLGTNLRTMERGVFNAQFMGISFGPALPFVHVVRHAGRCYLHNGYHRTYGLRAAGATHVPCIFRDVADPAAIGLNQGTFQLPLLTSNNPPTLAHFSQGRARNVQLRSVSRVLHVSWADYVLPNE